MYTIEHLMIKLCGHQMSCIMLYQSHLMLDMTVEGKRLGQIMIYLYGNQTISPVEFFSWMGRLKPVTYTNYIDYLICWAIIEQD